MAMKPLCIAPFGRNITATDAQEITNRLTPDGWELTEGAAKVLIGNGTKGCLRRQPKDEAQALSRLSRVLLPWGFGAIDARHLRVYASKAYTLQGMPTGDRCDPRSETQALNDWFNLKPPRGADFWYVDEELGLSAPAERFLPYDIDSMELRKLRVKTPLHIANAAVLLGDESPQVLLGMRSRPGRWMGYWETPGGKVEPGEDVFTAAIREFREEIGVTLTYQNLLHSFEFPLPEAGAQVFMTTLVFSMPRDAWWVPDLMAATDRSHCATAWVGLGRIPDYSAAGRLTPGTERALNHIIDHQLWRS